MPPLDRNGGKEWWYGRCVRTVMSSTCDARCRRTALELSTVEDSVVDAHHYSGSTLYPSV
jgi:hypothetical protein